jgi:hypothetical protein
MTEALILFCGGEGSLAYRGASFEGVEWFGSRHETLPRSCLGQPCMRFARAAAYLRPTRQCRLTPRCGIRARFQLVPLTVPTGDARQDGETPPAGAIEVLRD